MQCLLCDKQNSPCTGSIIDKMLLVLEHTRWRFKKGIKKKQPKAHWRIKQRVSPMASSASLSPIRSTRKCIQELFSNPLSLSLLCYFNLVGCRSAQRCSEWVLVPATILQWVYVFIAGGLILYVNPVMNWPPVQDEHHLNWDRLQHLAALQRISNDTAVLDG